MFLTALLCCALAANTSTLPPGKAKAIVARECKNCHALKVVTSKRATKEQWSALVDQMVSRGADVPDEEIENVVDYLAKNFGDTKKLASDAARSTRRVQVINVNRATATQLVAALGLSTQESAAIVSYRKANGPFKDWQEVTKVPGVETEKIARYKDRLAF
jgi:competence ComEA-like helix-hairpin-helix protein